jgi:hypothetical protein
VLCCALAAAGCLAGSPLAAADSGPTATVAKPKGGKKGKGKKGKGSAALRKLKRAGCAPYRVIDAEQYSGKVRRAAQRWKFPVFHFKSRLKPPINWERDPYESRSYRQQLHGLSWLDTLFDSYQRTGNKKVLRQAVAIAIDWIKRNPRSFVPGRSGFAWHPKAAADRAGYLGYLARTAACKGQLIGGQAQTLLRSLEAHGRYLSSGKQHQESNFGLFQDYGLLVLSQYVSFENEAKRWQKLALRRFPETLRGRLSSENMWLEHSAQYQFLAIRLLRDFIDYSPGKPDPALVLTLAGLRQAASWFVGPDGEYALLGDTAVGTVPSWGYSPVRQGLGAFPKSGYAMVRKGGSYLATTSTFFNKTHKHADELDFDLYDRGHSIVNGPGNYGYDREAAYRDYQLSSQSHSVLVVDGLSFPIDTAPPHGSGIRATGQGSGWYAIEGTNPLVAPQGVQHTRLYLYKPGVALVVVDKLRSVQQHTYQRFFQLGSDLTTQVLGPSVLGLSASGFAGALHESGGANRVLVKGRPSPLQGFVFPGFRKAVPRWSVEYSSKATSADYATTFTLSGAIQRGRVDVPDGNHTEVVLSKQGSADQKISVTRSGGKLGVSATSCSPCVLP